MTRRFTACTTLLVLSWQCGCASIVGRTERVDREVDKRQPVELHPKGPIVAKGTKLEGERLTAHVDRIKQCRPATLEHVTYQKVEARTSRGDVASIVLGLASIGASSYVLATRDQFSDETTLNDKGEEEASSRELATIWAGIGLAFGAGLAIHGTVIAAQSGDHDLPNPGHAAEHVDFGPTRACGTEVVESGMLQVGTADRTLGEYGVGNDLAGLDLRTRFGAVCLSDEAEQAPLLLMYHVEGDEPLSLGLWDAKNCHHMARARRALGESEKILQAEGALPPRVAKAAARLAEANREMQATPLTDREQPALQEAYSRVEGLVAVRAGQALDGQLEAFRRTLAQGPVEAVIDAAKRCLDVAATLPEREATIWGEVYGGLAASGTPVALGAGAVDGLWSIVDPATGTCAIEGASCPPHADQAAVRARLAPLALRIRAQADAGRATLDKSAKVLTAKATETNAANLKRDLAAATALQPTCARRWDDGLETACTALDVSVESATRLLTAKAVELAAARNTRTVNAWRAIFPRCRKVATFSDQLRAQSGCDAGCQHGRRLAQADLEWLQAFEVADGEMTPESTREVRNACQEARCPRCP
jgi:hypothetical protein